MVALAFLKAPEVKAAVTRSSPTVFTAVVALVLAWRHDGSVRAADWLPYAAGVGLLVATVLVTSARGMSRLPLVCAALVGGFGLWVGISALWSPLPALARDELLLTALYASALVLPVLTLARGRSQIVALASLTLLLGSSAVGIAAVLRFGGDPLASYTGGRLTAPVSYVNAQGAMSLIAFWPAIVLTAQRSLPALLRATTFGSAVAMLACWLMSQSKGGGIALAISAIVVFAFAPGRLRLLLPTLGAALLGAWSYELLTAPFRDVAGVAAIRDAGQAALILVVLAFAIGLAYALADARRIVSARVRRTAGLALVALSVGLLAVGTWQVERRVDHPLGWVEERWEEFKQNPTSTTGSSHLVSLGSNRYDFWRVGVNGFREHPVAGIGGRGFGQLYLMEKESYETPARSHSLALDALLETGLVGFALIGGALTLALVGLARRRATPAGLAALGALAYFVVHASGDWIWTFPAVGLPLFALVGIGLAGEEFGIRSIRARTAAAVAVAAFALLAFVPPWLSARLTAAALQGTVAVDQLRWARALDPLSVEPLLAEAALASTPASALAPLEAAVTKEPRAVGPRFLLGRAYLAAGRNELAREQLRIARRLSPDDELIGEMLERADRAAGSGGVAQSSG